MAEHGKRRWWSLSPAGFGAVVGINAFLWTMIIPAISVASHVSMRPSNPRPTLIPDEANFLEYVKRNWTEEAVVPRAFRIGPATGILAATSGVVARSLKCRQIHRTG